ncbi:MAG TPA: M48 family metalloprotease [Candidatus Binatia bacterium]|jgi:predicted Zn-dependent protease|nr:M48 family metalloprotease [Candidatus Binatia bacterium]
MRRVLLLVFLTGVGFHYCPPSRLAAAEGEAEIGHKFSLVALAQLPLVRDYTVQRYVHRLGQRLVTHLDHPEFPYQFSVVQEPHLNAFSVPGGYIYVHSGLLLRVSSADELAGVMGHEIAHVQGHHAMRQQQDTKWTSYAGLAAMALAIINPVLAAGASSAAASTQLSYQRRLEEEADYRGLQYLRQAGFDPYGMPRFLKKMWAEERLNATNVPPYFLSHPLSEERLSYIERTLRTFQWNQTAPANDFELEQVQAILRALQEPRTQVIIDYQKRVTENPDNPQALALLGSVFLRYNEWEQARQILEQASAAGVRLDRDLAMAYLRLGQRDRARQLFARQSETDPEDADAHNQLGKLFFEDGDLERAERECRAALELDPRLDGGYLTLAQIAGRQGNRGESLLLLAQAMEWQGRLEAALGQYQKATAVLGPDYPQAEELAKKTEELEQLVSVLRQQRAR